MLSEPPKTSATTGDRLPARMPASATGPQRSGSGAVARLDSNQRGPLAVFDLPPQAVKLQHSLAPLLAWGVTSLFSEAGFEGVKITDVAVRPGVSASEARVPLLEFDRLCEPCEPSLAARKLAELRALTVHRARDGVDVELMAGAFTERLAQYPADVVVAACDGWANREEFWPSWAELKAECDKRMRGRIQIRDALRKAAA